MSTPMHSEEKIGEAWRLHRNGDNKTAIAMFSEILEKTPNNVDACYGLGLARRANGDKTGAKEAFQTALKLAGKALDAVHTESSVAGHHGGNDLATYDDDRYMMLSRMLRQRLAELDTK